MEFLQSLDNVKKFIHDEFPVFENVIDTIELDKESSNIKIHNISVLFPSYQTRFGIEQFMCLFIDFSTRLFAYNSTGSSHINSENIIFLNVPEGNEFIISTSKMETSIAENALAYQSAVFDGKGTEIVLSTASQIIE